MDKHMVFLLITGLVLTTIVATWPGDSTDLKDIILAVMSVAQFALVVDVKKNQTPSDRPTLPLKEE